MVTCGYTILQRLPAPAGTLMTCLVQRHHNSMANDQEKARIINYFIKLHTHSQNPRFSTSRPSSSDMRSGEKMDRQPSLNFSKRTRYTWNHLHSWPRNLNYQNPITFTMAKLQPIWRNSREKAWKSFNTPLLITASLEDNMLLNNFTWVSTDFSNLRIFTNTSWTGLWFPRRRFTG